MADFTTGQNVGTATGSGVSSIAGSGDGAGTGAAIALDTASDLISIFGRNQRVNAAAEYKAQADTEAGTLTGAYLGEAAKISDAVQSGAMSSSEGRARIRSKFSQYLASNPAYSGDLMKAHKDYFSTSGLGKVVAEGSEEEQRVKALQGEADKFGMTVNQFVAHNARMEQLKADSAELAALTQLVQHDTALSNRDSANITLRIKRLEENSQTIVRELATDGLDMLDTQFNRFNTELTGADAVAAINGAYTEFLQTANVGTQFATESNRAGIIATAEDMRKIAIDVATGAVDKTVAENQLAIYKAIQEETLRKQFPQADLIRAMGMLLGNETVSTILMGDDVVRGDVLDMMGSLQNYEGADPNPNPERLLGSEGDTEAAKDQRAALEDTLKVLSTNLQGYQNLKPEEQGLVTQNARTVLETWAGTEVRPGQVQRHDFLMNFLADGKNASYWVNNHGEFADMQPQIGALLQNIGRNTGNIIEKEFNDISGLSVDFSGSGVMFTSGGLTGERPDPGYKRTYPGMTFEDRQSEYFRRYPDRAPGVDTEQVAAARRMNEYARPLINRYIRAVAHAAGHTNYAEVWEQVVKPQFFGATEPGPVTNAVEVVDGSDFDWDQLGDI